MSDNSNLPAFPTIGGASGLTKREYFAIMVMPATIAKYNHIVDAAEWAVKYADALLAELEKAL